jgi:hypothetical protein
MTAWTLETESLGRGRVLRHKVDRGGRALSRAEVIAAWGQDEGFRAWFTAVLAGAPFSAYFWETPPATVSSLEQAFEFVLVDSPALDGLRADPRDFAEHFAAAGACEEVVSFPNLGDDAFLVAPCPRAPLAAYPHLAAFARHAPAVQQHALWQAVSGALSRRLDQRPLWLSTSGLGVAWLHVRLDLRPKYYTFGPYRQTE